MTFAFSPRRLGWTVLVLGVCCFTLGAARAENKAQPSAMIEAVSDMQARLLTLEQTVAQLNGQIEELRFKNQQLTKQLTQVQDDLNLRVAALEQGAGRPPGAPLPTLSPSAAPAPSPATQPHAEAAPSTPPVYDPNGPLSAPVAKQPEATPLPTHAPPASAAAAAQGAPDTGFVLRTDSSGKALPADPSQPSAPPPAAAKAAPPPTIKTPPPPGSVGADSVASGAVAVTLPKGTPKEQYEFAANLMRQQDYARAESAFRAFLKANPNDPLAPNAQYWLGESLYGRGDYQQAAVEFMTGYQNYRNSPKGPDNLLKMGMALANMRQISGACTAFGSIAKEYPNADDRVRKEAQAQRAKLKCQ